MRVYPLVFSRAHLAQLHRSCAAGSPPPVVFFGRGRSFFLYERIPRSTYALTHPCGALISALLTHKYCFVLFSHIQSSPALNPFSRTPVLVIIIYYRYRLCNDILNILKSSSEPCCNQHHRYRRRFIIL